MSFGFHRTVLITAICTLSACGGGGGDVSVAKVAAVELKVIAPADVPSLARCIGLIGAALRARPDQREVGLACATGVYQGLTMEGRSCSLEVEGAQGEFSFKVERDLVVIKWSDVAVGPDGRAVHNLEDASAPLQPGVQLTRFTSSPTPVSEALILRMTRSAPVLPKMTYQRSEGNGTASVQCNFGA